MRIGQQKPGLVASANGVRSSTQVHGGLGTRHERVPSRDLEGVLALGGATRVSDKQKRALEASANVLLLERYAAASGAGHALFQPLVASLLEEYAGSMDYSKIITIEPGQRSGKPCIRGMRITVSDVLEYLASGMTEEQILTDFPELTREDIRACLAFAADREKRLTGSVA